MKSIYICGPYRGEVEKNVASAVELARIVVREMGREWTPVIPHVMFNQIDEEADTLIVMSNCVTALSSCDGIAVRHSDVFVNKPTEGMIGELIMAFMLGIPIFVYTEFPSGAVDMVEFDQREFLHDYVNAHEIE